jgi:endonuclease I/V8-like Glu-specific endopeptidase
MYAAQQVADTEERFAKRRVQRERLHEAVVREGIVKANPPENVRRRAVHMERARTIPDNLRRQVSIPPADNETAPLLERVIDQSELMNVNYLALATRAARSVGRVRERSAAVGTGFMVSPRLFITNNHVLPDLRTAQRGEVDFGYEDDVFGQPATATVFRLDPEAFFLTDEGLDYTLVAVGPRIAGATDLSAFGWLPLIRELGKLLGGELVNIIQHPDGQRKQVALRQNKVVDLLEDFIHYHTDTNPGSSGSPVLNDQWEVVALHHSGVPRRNARRQILNRDGKVWKKSEGDDAIDWIANEGVRVSRLVAHIEARPLADAPAALRSEMLDVRIMEARALMAAAAAMPRTTAPMLAAEVVIPIELRLASTSGVAPAAAPGATSGVVAPSAAVASADPTLVDLDEAAARPYYETTKDRAEATKYFRRLRLTNSGRTNFERVADLLTRTHKPMISYHASRMALYSWVDLQEDLMLRSIYSARRFEPRDVILEDLAVERAQTEALERIRRDPAITAEAVAVATLEAVAPFNCEHVVPQSWFAKRDPMKSDLHHLFTCEWDCNSFRGNTPYFDFLDFLEVDRDACGRRVGNQFEPEAGKGAVARATLYFLLRYPGEVDVREFETERIATLLAWHAEDLPSRWERHRNAAIFELQGNRNPLVDRPQWAGRLDFARGLLTRPVS